MFPQEIGGAINVNLYPPDDDCGYNDDFGVEAYAGLSAPTVQGLLRVRHCILCGWSRLTDRSMKGDGVIYCLEFTFICSS